MKLSLVIPCYNEEKNIEPFMECCIETFGNNKNIEYIFINDGSKDNTFSEIKKIIEKAKSMNRFYTPEQEKEYGVVGIKIEIIK